MIREELAFNVDSFAPRMTPCQIRKATQPSTTVGQEPPTAPSFSRK